MSNNSKQNGHGNQPSRRLRFIIGERYDREGEGEGEREENEESRMEIEVEGEETTAPGEDTNTNRRDANDNDSESSTDEELEWGRAVDWEGDSYASSQGDGAAADETEQQSPKNRNTSSQLPKVLTIPKPKHNWFVIKEVLKRETGDFRTPLSFTKRFYGSLHAVQRLELMYKLDKHTGCVNAINFNSSGTRLISGSDDRMVAVWNWIEGKCLTTFNTGHISNVFQCKYLPLAGDGHIVTCSRDGQVRLALQNSSGGYDCTEILAQHTRSCHKISLIQQEPHMVISAGADAQVFSIDVREKKPKRLLYVKEKHKKVSLYSVHVNPLTGNEFCVSGEDHCIRIYDRRYIHRSGQADLKFYPHQLVKPYSVYVTCAVFNYNGSEVIGSYNDDDIYLFDTKGATESNYVHRYEGHRNSETVKGVNFFGPKSEYIVSGSDCGNIYFWDKHSEAIVQWMRGDEEGVINCLEPHPKIPVLATSGLDSDIKIWVPSCEQAPTMDGLAKVIRLNKKKRTVRSNGFRNSLNDTLVRWWRQMRYMHRNQSLRDNAPIFIEIGALTAFHRMADRADESSSEPSSSSSSSLSSDD